MIKIVNSIDCSGCTACASSCPQKCIEMKQDKEGFYYPIVNLDNCIDCGLCEKVCPVKNNCKSENKQIIKSFIARTQSINNLKSSTSGGMFIPMANFVLENDGVICAAGYDDDFTVKHFVVDINSNYDISKMRGSKYVQSFLGNSFETIRNLLIDGKNVLFIGTPCQVAGLKSFLRKEYDNLITVDLVCHGVPSPLLWGKYINYQSCTFKSKISKISFRSKIYGYHSGGMMEISFENGKKYISSARTDIMLRSFFSEICSRPICYECPFKGINRVSDITLYDCWHYKQLTGKKDDDLGYTNIIIRNSKAEKFVSNLQIDFLLCDTKEAVKLDGLMIDNSAKKDPNRDYFYDDINNHNLRIHAKMKLGISKKDYIIEFFKKFLYRIGILQRIKTK